MNFQHTITVTIDIVNRALLMKSTFLKDGSPPFTLEETMVNSLFYFGYSFRIIYYFRSGIIICKSQYATNVLRNILKQLYLEVEFSYVAHMIVVNYKSEF